MRPMSELNKLLLFKIRCMRVKEDLESHGILNYSIHENGPDSLWAVYGQYGVNVYYMFTGSEIREIQID